MPKQSLIELMAFSRDVEESFEAAQLEYEVEIYLKDFDYEQIRSMSASHEVQEQWGIYVPKTSENASSGSVRVRMTEVMEESPSYVLTIKTDQGESGKLENEEDVDEVAFRQFKLMADQGLKKTRFHIPHETTSGIKFTLEADVFYNAKGERVEWVKLDAELPEGATISKEDIPLTYGEIIIVTPGEKQNNLELSKKIGRLYETYFRSRNEHVEEERSD